MAATGTVALPPSGFDILGQGTGSPDLILPDSLGLLRPCHIPDFLAAVRAELNQDPMDLLPNELVLDVFRRLPLSSVLALSRTSKRFQEVYLANRSSIVMETLPSEFSPLDGLLRVAAMSAADLNVSLAAGFWVEKTIKFKGRPVCRPTAGMESIAYVAHLGDTDVDRILDICRITRGWERIFPHYRFSHHPEQLRKLTASEGERLRSAVYTWMRYDYYFHGDLPRPSALAPSRGDLRCNMIRTLLSSGEEAELTDLWLTAKDAVRSLCPSLKAVLRGVESTLYEEAASRIAWGIDYLDNQRVVATMLKVGPERLLHFINNKHEYSKAKLIREARQERPEIETDIESLSAALDVVNLERCWPFLRRMAQIPPTPREHCREAVGGILDWGEQVEPLRGIVPRGCGSGPKPYEEEEDDDEYDDETEVEWSLPAGALEP